MIKPNTLCMIRGVPQNRMGSEFNGQIIVVTGIKGTHDDGSTIYWIEPALLDKNKHRFNGCREQWLYPFEDPDTLGLTNTDKELEKV